MVHIKATLTAMVMVAVVVLESISAFPMKYYIHQPLPPVRLNINAPVSGTEIALARGQALFPFVNPGIPPVGDYGYYDDVIAGGYPSDPYKPDIKNDVVILNKPGLDNGNIHGPGGHHGPIFY